MHFRLCFYMTVSSALNTYILTSPLLLPLLFVVVIRRNMVENGLNADDFVVEQTPFVFQPFPVPDHFLDNFASAFYAENLQLSQCEYLSNGCFPVDFWISGT